MTPDKEKPEIPRSGSSRRNVIQEPSVRDVTMLHRDYCVKRERPPGSFIVVEANIAGGKTEMCNMLARFRQQRRKRECVVLFEPVDELSFLTLLDRFQKEPKRWAATFQMYALKERFRQHTYAAEIACNGTDVIQDRSIYADGCFAATAFNRGNMDDIEWEVYADTFGHMKRFLRYPDLMIFLNVSPETCVRRATSRGREEELDTVTLEYFQQLHDQHIKLVNTFGNFCRTLVIDWENFGGSKIAKISDKIDEMLKQSPLTYVKDWLHL